MGVFGGYTRWAVVFLIIFVLFFLLCPGYVGGSTTTTTVGVASYGPVSYGMPMGTMAPMAPGMGTMGSSGYEYGSSPSSL